MNAALGHNVDANLAPAFASDAAVKTAASKTAIKRSVRRARYRCPRCPMSRTASAKGRDLTARHFRQGRAGAPARCRVADRLFVGCGYEERRRNDEATVEKRAIRGHRHSRTWVCNK
jgi:hypothetical protein